MSQSTPRLTLPFIQPAQAQKHITHNEALRGLDLLVQMSFLDDALTEPPSAPDTGDCYIVPTGATGAWNGQEGAIAAYLDGQWQFTAPRPGWRGLVLARSALVFFDGTDWQATSATSLQNATRLGLGMAADANTPFAAKLNAALWTALYAADGGTGDMMQTFNKESAGANAGWVLQDDFQTRALMGLFGDNDLRLSVSADGSNFTDALRVDSSTGIAHHPTLPRFSAHTNYDNYVGVGTWTKIGINVADSNDQGCFDPATNLFTAPADGTYHLGASMTYKTNGNSGARMQGRLVLGGTTALAGATGEVSGTHNSETTTLALTALADLSTGNTIELQGNFRSFDGYMMADETVFWGYKVG